MTLVCARWCTLLLSAVLASAQAGAQTGGSASASDTTPAVATTPLQSPVANDKSRRLQAAVANMLPIGKLLESTAAQTPTWPIQNNPGAMSGTQLQCVRSHMREADYQRIVAKRVDAYIRDNPNRIDDDLRMLEGPTGKFFAKSIQAGIDSASTGSKPPDTNALIASTNPEGLQGMVALTTDPQDRPLRDLIGLQGSLGGADPAAAASMGQGIAKAYMVPMLMDAMATCQVSLTVLKSK